MLRAAARTGHADGLISTKKLVRLALENRQYEVRNAVVVASALEAELSPLEQRKFHILIQSLYRRRIQRMQPFQIAIRLR